jgi:sodium-dependent dicarboxylate transporter 2/3/5
VALVNCSIEAEMETDEPQKGPALAQQIGFWAGLAVALAMSIAGPPEGLTQPAWVVATLGAVMAIWWVSEALPLAVTSLLPLIVLPLCAGFKPVQAASQFANPILFLFIGGFLIAIAVERWGLSSRIAFSVVAAAGPKPRLIVAGFMAATAFVSMWISNTATAMMMIPLAVGVAAAAAGGQKEDPRFAFAMILGVTWAATIGGVATPIGSPTNIIAVSWLEEQKGLTIPFLSWMAVGVPIMLTLLAVGWVILARGLNLDAAAGRAAQAEVQQELQKLGPLTSAEARVGIVFGLVALAWVSSQWLTQLPALMGLDDSVIALIGALVLFALPAGGAQKRPLMTWEDAGKLPWGIILLFGGGLALADAATETGLAKFIGAQLGWLQGLPLWLVLLGVVTLIIALTEFASNVATVSMMLPILGGLVIATGHDPSAFIVPAAIAASTGFMMPVGTAANAIAYGTGKVQQARMMKLGFLLNLAAVFVLVLVGVFLAPIVLG